MRPPNWDRAWKVYDAIKEDEGIDLRALTKKLGLDNIGDVRASMTVLGNQALLSEDSHGGLYVFGEYGLRE